MKITINLSKKEREHIKVHTFYDCCFEVETIMKKVQKACKTERTHSKEYIQIREKIIKLKKRNR